MLGWFPSSVAAVRVLSTLGSDEASSRPFEDFVGVWRGEFVRANAVGWPASVVLAVLGVNLWVLSVGGEGWMAPVLVATVCVALWMVTTIAYLTVLLADERSRSRGSMTLWRAALALPLASPGPVVAWAVSAVSLLVVAWRFPILVPLAVPGLLALLTGWLMRRTVDQTGIFTADDSRTTISKSA